MTTVLADRYELAEPLGSGGMARVVAAHDRTLQRRVAVKLVRDELVSDPVSRRRLLAEARAAAALHHPNAVAVFDVGEEDGRSFIVMELVTGETLADRLAARGRLEPHTTVELATAVLAALGAAHRLGLVHRDVKPANILLPDTGGVKLADFGIARVITATATLTATGQIMGTPRYLSPEQAAGEPATTTSDLYALGVVLYECLAGRPPFTGEHPLAVAAAHQRDPVPPLAALAPDVPPALAAAVEQALAKDPGQRYPDAEHMARALQDALADPAATAALPPAAALGGATVALPGATAALPGATAALPGAPPTLPDAPAGTTDGDGEGGTPAPGAPRSRLRGWQLIAGAVVAAALVGLGAALSGSLGAGETAAPLPTDDPPAAEPDGGDDPAGGGEDEPPDPGPPDPGPPADLGELLGVLARDPDAAGERGTELVEELLALRAEEPAKAATRARGLMADVGGWMADGELDAGIGAQTITLLAPRGQPEDGALAEAYALFTEAAAERAAWGEKSGDLLDDLDELFDAKPKDWGEDAEDLIEDLEDWADDGEIDRARAQRAIAALAALAEADGPGSRGDRD